MRIALVSPHAWPPRDDVAEHVAAEAGALASLGHRVSVLAPAAGRERLAAGRARLAAREGGDREALLAAPGQVCEVALGRALPSGRGLAGPRDFAAGLETALSGTPFDVVHLHEPLAPSPALAALRHASGVTAATFHRPDQLAGVAFLRPLVDRALARCDLRIATSAVALRAVTEVLPGDYLVVPPGVHPEAVPAMGPDGAEPGVVLVARGRERAGARFLLSVVRALDRAGLGPVTLLGPAEAPWRTRAAVPKALRDAVTTVADTGPAVRAAALTRGRIALFATPADAAGPALLDAMAAGMAIVAPRCPELEGLVRHGEEALVLPPYTRDAWAQATAALVADGARRRALGARAASRGRARPWSVVAEELTAAYAGAMARRTGAAPRGDERIAADLLVRPGPGLDADALVAACRRAGVGAIVAAGRGGLGPALEVAAAAPPGLAVVVGQEIVTDEGAVVGLFLSRGVPDGLGLAETADRIAKQGGLLMLPHPDVLDAPRPQALRAARVRADLHEVLTAAGGPPSRAAEEAARLVQALGIPACAGSGAERPEEVGAVTTQLRPFAGPEDLLDALADARLVRRAPAGRDRRPGGRPHMN